ncbi:MAG: Rne/Rng family ribonuclease [Gammaproteobacteria bacterium]|nr:Rne/Rng family ribonuclease [Gammaproteobacteria bacterium]
MKRMLVNATQQEEVRVALVDGQQLYDLAIEHREKEQKKGNIYKGRIARVEPSLEAAFVDFGAERHGFLPLENISREYFRKDPEQGKGLKIAELVAEGQQLVVQVEKDERDNKGAALSTLVSLPGRYLVLNANNPRGGGVSRQVRGDERQAVQQRLGKLTIPKGMSVIIRTQGHDRSAEELQWDLDNQLRTWEAIKLAVLDKDGPFLVVQESSVILRAIRDYLSDSIGEVVVDDDHAYTDIRNFMKHTMPHFLERLRRHEGDGPLFNRYQIESQIDSAYRRRVNLPSGGQIIIDQPEAGICVDVNSARATSADDIEQTAFQTNLEAADEIARQCRIRDLSGLIMIDFIDMRSSNSNRQVEERLRQATRNEPARIQIGQISRFGIMEMSRQRLRTSLVDTTHETCPRCGGTGRIRSVESLGLHILRMISEEAGKERTSKVVVELPLVVANFLLNEKRSALIEIEEAFGVSAVLVANAAMDTPQFLLRRIRDKEEAEEDTPSYEMATVKEAPPAALQPSIAKPPEKPAVERALPDTALPEPKPKAVKKQGRKSKNEGRSEKAKPKIGFFARLFGLGKNKKTKEKKPERPAQQRKAPQRSRSRRKPKSGPPRQQGQGQARSKAKGQAETPSKRGNAGEAGGAQSPRRRRRRRRRRPAGGGDGPGSG